VAQGKPDKETAMQRRKLGASGIDIPLICLGTMTWGSQNTEKEAFAQMDYALDQGVFFWDTAEAYAVPPSEETYGATEKIIGHWFEKTGKRQHVVLASKVAGRTPHPKPPGAPAHHHDKGLYWIREGKARHDRANITAALEGSLTRLKTDYIDLYQLHWPDRPAPRFTVREFHTVADDMAPDGNYDALMIEVLETMRDLIQSGKIRAWGLSNETPWGVMKYLTLAEKHNLPKPVSVQNPYNLLDRRDEGSLSELCIREHIAYLPYSPLAGGVLSGKYLDGQWPEGARCTNAGKRGRYLKPICDKATADYVSLAKKYALDPAQMALAFVNSRDFVSSNIIGATKMDQLKTNIESEKLKLPAEVSAAIQIIHENNPNPGC
jgi:aryl-alcohol dehydrogenase-like predicted oxidoreductase